VQRHKGEKRASPRPGSTAAATNSPRARHLLALHRARRPISAQPAPRRMASASRSTSNSRRQPRQAKRTVAPLAIIAPTDRAHSGQMRGIVGRPSPNLPVPHRRSAMPRIWNE
jgi:hypothetical protein